MSAVRAPSTCPECGDDLRPNAKRCKCGWKVPRAEPDPVSGRSAPPPVDVEYGWCAWRSGGERCRNPGTMAHSTLGGGPWYCAAHFSCVDPIVGGQLVDESIADRGERPDYSSAARTAAIKAKWHAEWLASGGAGRLAGAREVRAEMDAAVLAMTHRQGAPHPG